MSKEQGSESTVSRSQYIKEEEMEEEKEAPKRVSRRQFVKGAAVGGAGIAAAGMLASCAPAPVPTTAPGETAAPAPTCPPAAECPPAGECAPCPTPWIPETWDEEVDVVVCGSGAGALPAAIDAYDAGADVLIIERNDWLGGSFRRSGGGIVGAGTIVQKDLGVEDSPDAYYNYLLKCNENDGGLYSDPALMRVVADTCGANVDWIIEELGSEMRWERVEDYTLLYGLNKDSGFKELNESFEGGDRIPRTHWFTPIPEFLDAEPFGFGGGFQRGLPGGSGLFKGFDDAIQARGIRIMLETPLLELVTNWDGEVLGVKALTGWEPITEIRQMSIRESGILDVPTVIGYRGGTPLYIKANKGVVLACGSFAANTEMVANYTPAEIGVPGIRHPDNETGEGIIAAHAVGAALLAMGVNSDLGGVRINPKAQVIDVYGQVIPRLYAAPFTATGTYPLTSPGSGHHNCHAVAFGRIAGQNAAALEPWV